MWKVDLLFGPMGATQKLWKGVREMREISFTPSDLLDMLLSNPLLSFYAHVQCNTMQYCLDKFNVQINPIT